MFDVNLCKGNSIQKAFQVRHYIIIKSAKLVNLGFWSWSIPYVGLFVRLNGGFVYWSVGWAWLFGVWVCGPLWGDGAISVRGVPSGGAQWGIWGWLWFSCGVACCRGSLISAFRVFFLSIGEVFILAGGLGARILWVLRLFWYFLIS